GQCADQQALEEQLFTIVNQLNQGRDLAIDAGTRALLVDLNYQAGLKARSSIAFETSLGYFQASSELLPEDSWQSSYEQTAAIWYELFTANGLLLNYDQAFETAAVLLANARSPLEQARCYRQLVRLHTSRSDFGQAIAVGNQALALLGGALPTDPQLL